MNPQGEYMHELAQRLYPIGRSLTGNGVRETLAILAKEIPGLTVHEVPSGTKALDWTVPQEWNVREAYIITPDGTRIADYKAHTLHLVGYSTPIRATMSLEELQLHLHSLPEQPDAIPYVTSYYAKQWGFCITHNEREMLKPGEYTVVIDSELTDGSLSYAECILPGTSKKEILLSTYICHPSMANNELSGPVLATALSRWIASAPRIYTYRIIFIPEMIGSLVYLSKHLDHLKESLVAGFVLTCVGDERAYSYMPSRAGTTIADRVALRTLSRLHPDYKQWSYLERGSDERNYCSPGADLPVVSMMRSRYGTYDEYHTSLDDLSLVTPAGLQGSFDVHVAALSLLEQEPLYKAAFVGEPQLSPRGLYPSLSKKGSVLPDVQLLVDTYIYADGTRLPADIADVLGKDIEEVRRVLQLLHERGLVVES